jgi:hypothetical protein
MHDPYDKGSWQCLMLCLTAAVARLETAFVKGVTAERTETERL